ncbi:hypothetical protein JAB8_24960 [Janthinobacterium sp. HH106]|uniref:hypothetical protein n=1 Tax=Janthinobacterium sp. HH106 TaxID=1537278 RepID=UPI0008751A3F|nr:hypothetical protein [Janthinobacterium sp. HH106]OEZ89493.1 hypothetical protein JAB8_24960 [Janthinobacterium sp. HH106]
MQEVPIGEGAAKTPQQEEEARREFIAELWRRFEALQEWAVSHWPDQQHPLSSADFVETRKEILSLRSPAGSLGQPSQNNEAEPEQGGAQYQDVTPAPWP